MSPSRAPGKLPVLVVFVVLVLGSAGIWLWHQRTNSSILISLGTSCDGKVRFIFAQEDGRAYLFRACSESHDELQYFDPQEGTIWRARLPGIYPSLSASDPPAATLEDGILTVRVREDTHDGPNIQLGFRADSGELLWQREPFDWPQNIGSFTASFPDTIIQNYWDDGSTLQRAIDRATGRLLWTSNQELSPQRTIETDRYLVDDWGGSWRFTAARTGENLREVEARDVVYSNGRVFALRAEGVFEIDLGDFSEQLLVEVEGASRMTVGFLNEEPIVHTPYGAPPDSAVLQLEEFNTWPLFVNRSGRLGDQGYPINGDVTPFVVLLATFGGTPLGLRLIGIDVANRSVIWTSRAKRTGDFGMDVFQHGDSYYCYWDERPLEEGSHPEETWILRFDGDTGNLANAVTAPHGLSMRAENLAGGRLWLQREFSEGQFAVLDTDDLSLIYRSDPSWIFEESTDAARRSLAIR